MADEYADNFAEEDDGDIEVIQEQADVLEQRDEDVNQERDKDKDDDEQTKQIIKAKKRVVRPMLKLDTTRLVGPRGIGILESTFKDIKFKGKGYELEDLNKTMRILEHWAHRLFPKMTFDDCLDKIEDLGCKRALMVHVTKIRLGMEDEISENPVEDIPEEVIQPVDPFDQLIADRAPAQQQPPPLTDEQRARMLRNRLIAEEIRMKKMQARQEALKAQQAIASQELPLPAEVPASPTDL